jgi:hypothetical protein
MSSSPNKSLKRRAILVAAISTVAVMFVGTASASAADFYLNNSQNNPTDHCYTGYGPGSYRDLVEGGPTGATSSTFSGSALFGCTRAFPAGGELHGNGSLELWFTNTNKKSCTTSWFLYHNASPTNAGSVITGSYYNGNPAVTVPAGTKTPKKFVVNFYAPATSLYAGDQLMLHTNVRTASGSCSNMTLYYGSASHATKLSLPTLVG